jgi:Circularly permutated YpsA SLOG family
MIVKIISGGQTGADRGALDFALAAGIPTGGWAPEGFRTETGTDLDLIKLFGLTAHSSRRYAPRTQSNVLSADGTLIFGHQSSPGAMLTRDYAGRHNKPLFIVNWFHLTDPVPHTPDALFIAWLNEKRIRTLNVAGNRESRNPGIHDAVMKFLALNLRSSLTPRQRDNVSALIPT